MPNLSFGARYLIDRRANFIRSAHKTHLRLQNFSITPNPPLWAQLGFSIAPTGTIAETSGYTDIEIRPWPPVQNISEREIGLSGGKLKQDARVFLISHTFVLQQMNARNLVTPDLVFRSPQVIGIVLDGMLFDIADTTQEELAGETVSWVLKCNAVNPFVTS